MALSKETENMDNPREQNNFEDNLLPFDQFLRGDITVEAFNRWLVSRQDQKQGARSNLISQSEQDFREDVVRQSTCSVELEGLRIPIESELLNKCYIRGEIDLDQKRILLFKILGIPLSA